MTAVNPNSAPPLPELVFLKNLGLAYKVGLAVAAIGVFVVLASGILGGVFYELVLSVLELLDAPEDRTYLIRHESGAGSALMQYVGWVIVVCGFYVIGVRLARGMLGVSAQPEPTDNLGPVDRTGLGIVVIGVIVGASAAVLEALVYEILPREPISTIFSSVANFGALFVTCGLLVIILGGPRRRKVLLGWTVRLGWGKLGHSWANVFAIALLGMGLMVGMVGLEEAAPFLGGAGIAVFLLGIVMNYFVGPAP